MNPRTTLVSLLLLACAAGLGLASRPDDPALRPDRQAIDRASSALASPTATVDTERRTSVSARTPRSPYDAPVGSRFGFAFEHCTRYSLEILEGHGEDLPASPGETRSLPIRGQLIMQVLARDTQMTTVWIQGAGIETPISGELGTRAKASLEACHTALETWFLVHLDARGNILGYRFQEPLRARDRNLVRAIVAAFFHTVGEDAATDRWQAEGADATGLFVAEHRRIPAASLQVERSKQRYESIAQQADLPPHVLRGCSLASFDAEAGWIQEVTVTESFELELVDFPSRVHTQTEACFTRVDVAGAAIDLPESRWPRRFGASGAGEDLAADARIDERAAWQEQLAEVSFRSLLVALRTLVEAGETRSSEFYAAWERLAWKLALDPKAVSEAQQLLLAGALREDTGSMLLSALGKAGSGPAQNALLAVFGARGLETGWRESAAMAMFQLVEPSSEVLATLTRRVGDLRQIEQLDATSLLVLGTLAPRHDKPLASGKTAFESLVGLEARARDLGASGLWLDALGNAATPAVAPFALPYLQHSDALVREAAVTALDRSQAKGITAALIRVAQQDATRGVRLAAIEALGKRGDAAARQTIRDLANNAEDAGVRRFAAQQLGEHGKGG